MSITYLKTAAPCLLADDKLFPAVFEGGSFSLSICHLSPRSITKTRSTVRDVNPIAVNDSRQSGARFEHLVQDPLQGIILQGGGDALLVAELLVDLVILGMGVLLDPDVYAVVGGQRLLQTDADSQAKYGGEGAVRDSRGQVDQDLDQLVGV